MAKKAKVTTQPLDDVEEQRQHTIESESEPQFRYAVLDDDALPGNERDDDGCVLLTESEAKGHQTRGVGLVKADE